MSNELKKKLGSLTEEREFLNKEHRIETNVENRIEIRKEKDKIDKEKKAVKRKLKKYE